MLVGQLLGREGSDRLIDRVAKPTANARAVSSWIALVMPITQSTMMHSALA
jgi:hypothetical protein